MADYTCRIIHSAGLQLHVRIYNTWQTKGCDLFLECSCVSYFPYPSCTNIMAIMAE